MCQRVISVIIGKYLDQLMERNGRLVVTIIDPHSDDPGKRIEVEVSKTADTIIKAMPLTTVKHESGNMWSFIERFLPDYYHRGDILHHDIYSRYLDNEELSEGDAEWIYADFGSNKEKVKETFDQMEKDFAYEALENWLSNQDPDSW